MATGVETAREAASRYAWREAFDLYAAADAASPLEPDDLNLMAECGWWIGKMRHCIALRERAHAGYVKAGKGRRAARVAIDLAEHHGGLYEVDDAMAWIQKATRMLEAEPEAAEHGWLQLSLAIFQRHQGNHPAAASLAAEAQSIGARHADPDLLAMGLALHGLSLAVSGDPEAGLPLVEESTQGAVAGDLGPRATGWIYCMMIAANAQIADWQTAGHWTEAAVKWCNRQSINGFPGVCRIHRAEILRMRGALSDAEEEARVATAELASFNLVFTALAFHELGEVRVKMGDLEAAEEAFRQASEMGVSPQPGQAMLLLRRGRPQAAAIALRRALAPSTLSPLDRARLLPAQLEVALRLDDMAVAQAAVTELDAIAKTHTTSPALRATADAGAAALALVEGRLGEAGAAATQARDIFDEIDLRHESARASLLLGQIHQARGDAGGARAHLTAALTALEHIGAVPDAHQARDLLAAL